MTEPTAAAPPAPQKPRRRWLKVLITLLIIVSILLLIGDPPPESSVYIEAVDQQGATLSLITRNPEQLVAELTNSVNAAKRKVDETGTATRHRIRVNDLLPDTRYNFVIRRKSDGTQLDSGSFATAPASMATKTRFVAVGDSGKVPWWFYLRHVGALRARELFAWTFEPRQWEVARRSQAESPNFFLHLGDIIYSKRHYRRAAGEAFFLPFEGLLKTTPLFTLVGNHDIEESPTLPYLDIFNPVTNPVTKDGRAYTFAWGCVRIVALDSMDRSPETGLRHAGNKMLTWIDKTLRAAEEPWLLVALHIPIISASRSGDDELMIKHLLPILKRNGVDLVFAGHDHVYERMDMDGIPHVIAGAGGKSLYKIGEHDKKKVGKKVYSYVVVEADPQQLRIKAKDLEGNEIDAMTLANKMRPHGEKLVPAAAGGPK